jgi:hypothetical protein
VKRRVIPGLIALIVCVLVAAVLVPANLLVSTAQAQTTTDASADAPLKEPSEASPAESTIPARELVSGAVADQAGVSRDVLNLALGAVTCAVAAGDISAPPTLTLIDYSRPSTEPRLWVFDLRSGEMRFRELVAHGKGTGENLAQHFSDSMNSHQTSLGLFVTQDPYVGSNGYSLRLDGLEPGFNGRARERAIVMHGAAYVDAAFAAKQGRLGRSWGCPALRQAVARQVIDFIRDGGVIFSYYPDQAWLKESRFLNCPPASANRELRIASRE